MLAEGILFPFRAKVKAVASSQTGILTTMANYIVSYDLNGSTPTHKQMDDHIAKKPGWARGRVLETVWYIGTTDTKATVYNHFNAILSANDRLLVVVASDATWRNLLLTDESLQKAWGANR